MPERAAPFEGAINLPASYVALLLGIDGGGKSQLPMKDLIGVFAESGCEQVKSYIPSGNVIFDAAPEVAP